MSEDDVGLARPQDEHAVEHVFGRRTVDVGGATYTIIPDGDTSSHCSHFALDGRDVLVSHDFSDEQIIAVLLCLLSGRPESLPREDLPRDQAPSQPPGRLILPTETSGEIAAALKPAAAPGVAVDDHASLLDRVERFGQLVEKRVESNLSLEAMATALSQKVATSLFGTDEVPRWIERGVFAWVFRAKPLNPKADLLDATTDDVDNLLALAGRVGTRLRDVAPTAENLYLVLHQVTREHCEAQDPSTGLRPKRPRQRSSSMTLEKRKFQDHVLTAITLGGTVLRSDVEGDKEAEAAAAFFDELVWIIKAFLKDGSLAERLVTTFSALGRDDFVEFFVKLDDEDETVHP